MKLTIMCSVMYSLNVSITLYSLERATNLLLISNNPTRIGKCGLSDTLKILGCMYSSNEYESCYPSTWRG